MAEGGNRFYFTSLRDCFIFFDWLKTEKEAELSGVVKILHARISTYYKDIEPKDIESHLTNFISKVETFYKKLMYQHVPHAILVGTASIKGGATLDDTVDALFECLPKFLAAIYYLWYYVSYTFVKLGGGEWKENNPGYVVRWWKHLGYDYGGGLNKYLISNKHDDYGGIIPGGFSSSEIRYGYDWGGYRYGYSMVTDLKNIFGKIDDQFFRDVFATSVLSAAGSERVNTANALALVNVFCDIVAEVQTPDGGNLKKVLEEEIKEKGSCSINWLFLKDHCSRLKDSLGKIFKENKFSFTGYGRKSEELNKEKFAKKAANWLRSNLEKVRKNLEKIKRFESEYDYHAHEFARLSKHHDMLKEYYAALGPYFTKNLFPYGFTFYGEKEFSRANAPYEDLRKEWDSVIYDLTRDSGNLVELKKILDGEKCPAPPKPRPRPAPAPRPPRPARPAPPPRPSRTTGGRTTGPSRYGGWSYSGRRTSGVRGGSDRGTGPKNRGGGPGAQGSRGRGAGSGGTSGAKSAQRGRSPGHTMSTQSRLLQTQDDSQSHRQLQLPPAASIAPRDPSPPAEQLPTPARLTSQAPARDHSSASSSSSLSSSVNDAGGTRLGPQATASGHSQESGKNLASNQDIGQVSRSDPPSTLGAGERVGAGGLPSTGRGLSAGATDSITRTAEPLAPPSTGLSQAQSIQRQNSLSHAAAGDGGPGQDGAPGSMGALAHPIPDSDSMVSSVIQPVVSSNARHAQTSRVQTPDSPSSRGHLSDDAQDLKDQAHSSNPTQKNSSQSSDVRSTLQSSPGPDSQSSAVSRGNDASEGGGVSAGGTDGDPHVNIHSGEPPNTSQPSVQPHTPTHLATDPPSSDITSSQGDMGLTVQSSSQVNPQGDTGDASGHSPASIPRPPGLDPLGESQDLATRVQQLTQVQGNGPLSQPGPALPVPPPPPSAPNPTTAADTSTPQSTIHGPVGAQGVHGQQAMQTPGPNSIGDTDSTGHLNQQVASSSTVAHGAHSKSKNGSPHLTSGTPTISQPDDIHGAVLTQPSSVSGPQSSLTAVSPSGVGQDPDDQASLLDPNLPHAKLSKAIPGTLPITSPGLLPGQERGGAAGSGSPGASIGGPSQQNGQATDNNLGYSGTSMNSGSDSSHQIPPQRSMSEPTRIELEIEKLYTPEIIYGADTIQAERLPATRYKGIVSPSDTYSNIPPHAPLHETFSPESLDFSTEDLCLPPWIAKTHNDNLHEFPHTELFPSEAPRTVREMLVWMVGLQNPKHHVAMEKCIKKAFGSMPDATLGDLKLSINDAEITPKQVLDVLKLTAMFAASVLSTIEPAWKGNTTLSATLKPKGSDQSKDPACLLCQLRDYAYACYYQLQFLRSQCSRNKSQGGWQDCQYGNGANIPSPLQAFLTDASASKFKTYPFDPCNICRKSRVSMGFKVEDLPVTQQTGNHISTILTPTCGGEDPLLTLSSYLNCLTKRTPRTTGELHDDCPGWDRLRDSDLHAIREARGSATLNSNHHDKDHPRTLSTLLGCGINNLNCPQLMMPITYRAYALYSSSFVHTYLSWTVHLADRLWDSLLKLQYDLEDLQCHDSKAKALHRCDNAMPLLYSHGFTPPNGVSQPSLTCSQLVDKLEEVVSGGPIAKLMTCMDDFLYGIRAPFLYTLVALWSVAALYIAHTMLYRLDVLHIRSHLLTTKASHLIDVKALLTHGRKMLSLYSDVDYFDDDFVEMSQ
ncbi:ribosome binding protein [Babesia ovata]|uniref:Ribosome binding protein n=1 Tax=Babesia ovata TaxID=189622 RepID=A0A2H6K8M3_9APIC|nr:ribosome binding protein [Babesia ovata]GBE59343.1 ribosome binding protein [Babesia ovata]